jgi:hypothetical protein
MTIFIYKLTPQMSGSISDNVKGKEMKRENREENGP